MSYEDEHRTPSRLRGRTAWLLGRAARQANQLTWASLADAGMRRGFYGVLATLDEFGPAAQAEIGRRVALDPSDMVDLLNDLEGRGFVRREQDSADRRRNIVTLTAAGSQALERFDGAISAAEDQLLASFSGSERATLLRLLRVLANAPERSVPDDVA